MLTDFILHMFIAEISSVYRPQTMYRKQTVKSKSSSKQNKPKIGFEQMNNSFEASDADMAPSDDFYLIKTMLSGTRFENDEELMKQ